MTVTDKDGGYYSNLDEWLQCPDCGSDNTSNEVGYDGDVQFYCNECNAWGTFMP